MNIAEITEMWHFTFTIDVRGAPEDHVVQYFGPQLATIFGHDYSGESMEHAMQDLMISNTIGFYDKAMDTGAPVSESSSFHKDGKEVRFRSLIVPFSSDGTTVDFVLGTTNYKIF